MWRAYVVPGVSRRLVVGRIALAKVITWAMALYCDVGLVFAVWFAFRVVDRLDPAAPGAGLGFRLLMLPGAMALWPVLLMRVRVGSKS